MRFSIIINETNERMRHNNGRDINDGQYTVEAGRNYKMVLR